MKQPVLARVGLGKYDRFLEFVRQANESAVAQMSVTEQATAPTLPACLTWKALSPTTTEAST